MDPGEIARNNNVTIEEQIVDPACGSDTLNQGYVDITQLKNFLIKEKPNSPITESLSNEPDKLLDENSDSLYLNYSKSKKTK